MTGELKAKMLTKVRKLLALAASANEHEAALAAEKAQAILAEYNLDMADVKVGKDEEDGDEIVIDGSTLTKGAKPWKRPLAAAVAKLYFCKYFFTHYKFLDGEQNIDKHSFVGSKANIAVASMMFEYLHKTIDKLAWKECSTVPKSERARFRNAFRQGAGQRVSIRIYERIEAAKAGKVQTMEGRNLPALLDLYGKWDKRNDDAIAAQVGKLKSGKNLMRSSHAAGWLAGRAAGDKIGLDTQVGGGGATRKIAAE